MKDNQIKVLLLGVVMLISSSLFARCVVCFLGTDNKWNCAAYPGSYCCLEPGEPRCLEDVGLSEGGVFCMNYLVKPNLPPIIYQNPDGTAVIDNNGQRINIGSDKVFAFISNPENRKRKDYLENVQKLIKSENGKVSEKTLLAFAKELNAKIIKSSKPIIANYCPPCDEEKKKVEENFLIPTGSHTIPAGVLKSSKEPISLTPLAGKLNVKTEEVIYINPKGVRIFTDDRSIQKNFKLDDNIYAYRLMMGSDKRVYAIPFLSGPIEGAAFSKPSVGETRTPCSWCNDINYNAGGSCEGFCYIFLQPDKSLMSMIEQKLQEEISKNQAIKSAKIEHSMVTRIGKGDVKQNYGSFSYTAYINSQPVVVTIDYDSNDVKPQLRPKDQVCFCMVSCGSFLVVSNTGKCDGVCEFVERICAFAKKRGLSL